MNILVIGLGSMGKRRIRLLKRSFAPTLLAGVDNREDRRTYCANEYGIITYSSIEEAFSINNFDCAFICTAPLTHNSIIKECLLRDVHVFSELNLINDGYDENIKLAKEHNKILFLSSTAFYRKEMQHIIRNVQNTKGLVNYTYHVGQYLKDWHPWESIEDFFVSNEKTNGCREILAIELPWLIKAFGRILDIKVISNKISKLNINYNDNYSILFKHEKGNSGVVVVDVVCREAIRNFLAYGEQIFIKWDGTPSTLYQKNLSTGEMEQKNFYDNIDKLDGYSSNIIENHYLEEINEFIDVIKGKADISYGFEEDKYTLNIIDQIEKVGM